MIDCYRYTEKVEFIRVSGNYVLDRQCNGYVAVNIGDTVALVYNKPIKPAPAAGLSGESVGVQGNLGEIYTGQNGAIPILFNLPLGTNPVVMIVEKIYQDLAPS